MRLAALLAGVGDPDLRVAGDLETEVTEVRDDSRNVRPGDLFVAIPGDPAEGRRFVADAVARGAAALVLETPASGGSSTAPAAAAAAGAAELAGFSGVVVTVASARRALAAIAANRFPAGRELTLTAVTGTNGKTTTTYLLEAMLAAAGVRAGVVGTISYRVAAASASASSGVPNGRDRGGAFSRTAPLTTPGALALHALFADMHAAGATDVVLEASSHALAQSRLDGCRFRVAGLTNLTQDHLDYHGSMESYFDAKAILFERLLDPVAGVAVLPIDLPEGRAMRARVRESGGTRTVLSVAAARGTTGADVVVESAQLTAGGMRIRLATPSGPMTLVSPLVGDYNLANIVLAVGMVIARGVDANAIAAGVGRLVGVPGRLERVPNASGVLCVVDYAHTPDAMERSLAVLRPLVAVGARLVTVFGCGGDRDRGKRPLMGTAAAAGSDLVIVTSDNPRGEDPQAIIDMIVEGVRRQAVTELPSGTEVVDFTRAQGAATSSQRIGLHVAPDRRLAIRTAVSAARPGDVLLIAGKGHEDYQIIGDKRIHFDDREEAAAAFAACTVKVER